jgi:hypothetical protein
MPGSISNLYCLLLQFCACANHCRQTIAKIDEKVGHASLVAPHSALLAELGRGAQEMMSALARYEMVCHAAVVLLNPDEWDGDGGPECD